MAGLIKNEFLTMRKVILLYTAVLVLYYVLGIFGTKMSGVQIFAVFFASMLVISSFSYGEKSGWNVYVNVLPVGRAQIVVSKYIFALICTLTASAVGIVIQCSMNAMNGNPVFQDIWVAGMAVMIAGLFLSVVLPVLFKTGAEKSRVVLMMIFLIPFVIVLLAEKMGIEFRIPMERLTELLPFAGLGTAALLVVSCGISIGIYKRKEF